MKKYHTFNIIKHHGTPKAAVLQGGERVHMQEKIYAPELVQDRRVQDGFFKCTDYGNHFIYKAPQSYIGPKYRCTCGSMAVLTGPSGYSFGSSQTKLMFVCQTHSMFLKHADGSS